jgi:hypothetical protein
VQAAGRAAARWESGGSCVFDDVDDACEENLKCSKKKDAEKAAGQVHLLLLHCVRQADCSVLVMIQFHAKRFA